MNYGFTPEGEQPDATNNDIPQPVTTEDITPTTSNQVCGVLSLIPQVFTFLSSFSRYSNFISHFVEAVFLIILLILYKFNV